MTLRVIALDFDGVVLESNEAKTKAFAEMMLPHGEEAAAAMGRYHHENRGISRFHKFQWFYETYLQLPATEEELAQCNERFNTLSMAAIMESPFVPGIEAVLASWAGKLPLYVVSGTPEPELRQIVTKRGLDKYFKDVLGTPTGKAEHLRDIMRREDVSPEAVLMVGDAQTDLNAALNTGIRFYGRGDFPGMHCAQDLLGLDAFIAALCQGNGNAREGACRP